MLAGALGFADRLPAKSEQERAPHKALATFRASGFGAYFNEVDRGGHFAAWEEPELFSKEVRTVFRPLRSNGGDR